MNGLLVEKSLASRRTAETGNAIQAANLALEFVVVGQLLVCNMLAHVPPY
jgi:hypothetical protein